jgi:cyclophilin family peptidyl-prolyl cis-trans isomerase
MSFQRGFLVLFTALALVLMLGCGSDAPPESTSAPQPAETAKVEQPPPVPEPEPPATEPEAPAPAPTPKPKAAPKPPANPVVVMETSKGNLKIELYPDKAPLTVKNFLAYVDSSYYDGTIFHRVIPNFMIQGGGFTADMVQKDTREPIENEAKNGVKNGRGTIAMARTFNPHSATSQFFINHTDNAMLDNSPQNGWGYCVFGKVIDGLQVVDSIASVQTGSKNGMQDVPVETVVIKSVRRAS